MGETGHTSLSQLEGVMPNDDVVSEELQVP